MTKNVINDLLIISLRNRVGFRGSRENKKVEQLLQIQRLLVYIVTCWNIILSIFYYWLIKWRKNKYYYFLFVVTNIYHRYYWLCSCAIYVLFPRPTKLVSCYYHKFANSIFLWRPILFFYCSFVYIICRWFLQVFDEIIAVYRNRSHLFTVINYKL